MVTQNFPHQKNEEKIFFEFLYQNHFLWKFRQFTKGTKPNLGQEIFLGGNGAPFRKKIGDLRIIVFLYSLWNHIFDPPLKTHKIGPKIGFY